jgi:hypothetical protein
MIIKNKKESAFCSNDNKNTMLYPGDRFEILSLPWWGHPCTPEK